MSGRRCLCLLQSRIAPLWWGWMAGPGNPGLFWVPIRSFAVGQSRRGRKYCSCETMGLLLFSAGSGRYFEWRSGKSGERVQLFICPSICPCVPQPFPPSLCPSYLLPFNPHPATPLTLPSRVTARPGLSFTRSHTNHKPTPTAPAPPTPAAPCHQKFLPAFTPRYLHPQAAPYSSPQSPNPCPISKF